MYSFQIIKIMLWNHFFAASLPFLEIKYCHGAITLILQIFLEKSFKKIVFFTNWKKYGLESLFGS